MENSNEQKQNKKSNKRFGLMFLTFLSILAVGFYWFEIRPSEIKKECSNRSSVSRYEYASDYEVCLKAHGL